MEERKYDMLLPILYREDDMHDFGELWKKSSPIWVVVCCRAGSADISLVFENHQLASGDVCIIQPDAFPVISNTSENFAAAYFVIKRTEAEEAAYGVPNEFYDAVYNTPIIRCGDKMMPWIELTQSVLSDAENIFRINIAQRMLHNIFLLFYEYSRRIYGDSPAMRTLSRAESLCMRFYDLIYDNFTTNRSIAFYADQLCITPNYLAMIVRRYCLETPKEAIDRLVMGEIKHLLASSDLTVDQIAEKLHFNDTSYMCRYFRLHQGLSPTDYRSNY